MKIRLLCLALLIGALALGINAREFKDWSNFKRYHSSNEEVIKLPKSQRKVVFMGNSITDSWASMRPQFFKNNGFIGRGISGQTSYQFLSRFREDVINLHPQVVVINAATNDVAENTHPYNEEMTLDNIASMVEIAKANGIKVVLTSTLPAAGFRWNPDIKDSSDKIASLNKRLRQLAKEKGVVYVDYYDSLVDKSDPGRRLNPAYSKDGVHPTVEGYEIMEAIITPVLKKMTK